MRTGWPPGLLQDDYSRLSKWLSQRGNARQLADLAAMHIIDTGNYHETISDNSITDINIDSISPGQGAITECSVG